MYPPDMPFMRRAENMDGRRQPYERMMYEQSQQQLSPRKIIHGGQGSLSQMDFAQYSAHQSSLEPLEGVPFSNMHPSPRPYIPPMGGSFQEGSQTEDINFSNEEPSIPPGSSNSQVHSQSQLSQEPIELLQQQSEILSLNTLTDDTLMSQKVHAVGLTGLDMSQQEEEYLHYHHQHARHPQKRKHPPPSSKLGGKSRMSLSDLSALPGNSQSLTETAFLSQSVQALQEHQQQATLPRQNKPSRSKSLHRSHEHLNKVRPNPESLQASNFYGPPGLINSIGARLVAPTSALTHGNKRQQQSNHQRHHTSSQNLQHHQRQKQQKQQQQTSTSSTAGSSTSSQAQPTSHTQPEHTKVDHRRGSSTDASNSDRSSASPEGSSTSLTQTSEPRLTKSGRR